MRSRSLLWLLIGVSLGVSCAQAPLEPRPPKVEGKTLKVMTFNINYGLAGDAETLAAIGSEQADIILLQETTPEWEALIRRHYATQYPHIRFEHCCGAGGLGVLSRYEIEPKDYIQAPQPSWFPAWRLIAKTPLGPVQLLNVHLRPPVSDSGSFVSGYFSTPKVRAGEIKHHAATLSKTMPTIIAGDFNEGADGEAVEALKARGMRSVLGQFKPDQSTWRWQTSVGTLNSQLDHILYDPAQYSPLNAYVVQAGRSDHMPVVAIFEAH